MELVNETPFTGDRFVLPDVKGRDHLVVVLKCTYTGLASNRVGPAEEQRPIQLGDEHYGKPDESSVRWESDLAPYKPGTDVVLIGHGWAPGGKGTQVPVSLRVGHLRRVVVVYGDRRWRRLGASAPEPFEKIPLVYERAFGGRDVSHREPGHHEKEDRNPVGRGLRAKRSALDLSEIMLPNLEDPAHLIRSIDDRPPPVGFGVVARHWAPRRAFAGNMGEAWLKARSPLPPEDLDPRFYNGASAGLVSAGHLAGNEPVEILGASATGALRFALPGEHPRARATIAGQQHEVALVLDTVTFVPDQDQLILTWRGGRPLGGDLRRLTEVRFGQA